MSEIKLPKIRRIGEIKDKRDLMFDEEKRNHSRNQYFLDFLYKHIFPIITIGVIFMIVIWFIIIMCHFIFIDDWGSFENFGIKIASYVFIFFFGILSKEKLIPKNKF
ncbi:MAG: hypothetical protein U9M94_03080 [Patescibacteria group bacterium]|nr:hypothetical protein [Patescibacteria group bacterium]